MNDPIGNTVAVGLGVLLLLLIRRVRTGDVLGDTIWSLLGLALAVLFVLVPAGVRVRYFALICLLMYAGSAALIVTMKKR